MASSEQPWAHRNGGSAGRGPVTRRCVQGANGPTPWRREARREAICRQWGARGGFGGERDDALAGPKGSQGWRWRLLEPDGIGPRAL